MWELKACRGCLSLKSKLEKYNEHTKKIYTSITGLSVDDNDGYPNFFCVQCVALMKKIMSFRRKMRRAHYVMKEIMLKKKQITFYDVTTVNRRRTNLRSTIGYWNAKCTGFYIINNEEKVPDNDNTANVDWTIDITQTINDESDKNSMGIREYKPSCNGNVRHIIDIVPEIEENVSQPVETSSPDDEIKVDEITPCDEPQDFPEDIDMTNVFGDLVDDPAEESNYELEDGPEDEFFKEKKKKKTKKDKELLDVETRCTKYPINLTSNVLSMCDIEIIPDEQQVKMFEKRKLLEPFLSAVYKCTICLTVYYDIGLLKDHVKKHNKSESHKHLCRICYLRFATKEHLEIHHSENHKYIYKCRRCGGRKFYSISNLLTHSVSHRNEKSQASYLGDVFNIVPLSQKDMYLKMAHPRSHFKCDECNMRFDTEKLLKRHHKQHTKMFNYNILCDICGTWHLHRTDLTSHLMTWHLYKYECKHCSEVFYNKLEAKHHKVKHANKVICEHCGKPIRIQGLPVHNMQNHYVETFIHDCVVCGKAFMTVSKMYEHQLKEHSVISINDLSTGDPEARCKVCNVQFHSVKSYRIHALKKQHEDALLFENKCIKCCKLFDTAVEYEEHMAVHNKIPYPRKCSYCDLVLSNASNFFKHQAKKHRDKPLEYATDRKLCELCGEKVFLMATHMRRHNQDIIYYECKYCDPVIRFPHTLKLVKHILAKHTQSPMVCAICDSGFSGRQECLDHILKLHAPEKPFKCLICSRSFSHNEYLRDHAKKLHNIILKKPTLKPALIKKNILIYPHMKVNLSLLKPAILETLKITMCSYDHTKMETLEDPKDHVIFDRPGEVFDEKMPKRIKRKWDINKGDDDEIVVRKRSRRNVGDEILDAEPIIKRTIEIEKLKEELVEDNITLGNDDELLNDNETAVLGNDENSTEIVINEPLQVFEENNERFVFINGVMYKVEMDD